MVSTLNLARISACGGVIVSATGYYLMTKIVDRTRNYDYYRNALAVLRSHPGATKLLGEPIVDKRFKLSDPESNFCDGKVARFKVPVRGSVHWGTYYFWAERIDEEWKLTRAELQFKNQPERRLAIVKESNDIAVPIE